MPSDDECVTLSESEVLGELNEILKHWRRSPFSTDTARQSITQLCAMGALFFKWSDDNPVEAKKMTAFAKEVASRLGATNET